ncbi:MAG TPA: PVC-type heme-binding CxxCH protein [Chryseolinea sp.]|nr:PVC-type heme-binding CxxCH protein [Chryseolinea sp.]
MMPARLFSFMILMTVITACHEGKVNTPLLYLPDDLEVTLWAESPLFYNPTNMDIDSRGRVWITEAVNYRNFNNDSTKSLHHSGGDRVMILEDTDGDGAADESKIFVQDKDLTSPLGIAVIGNKVYVSCSPHLIVYTDENQDDQPDKKEIFLTGFGGLDHDHSLHAIVGSMDGNLYFPTGNAGPHIVTDKSGWTLRSGSIYTGGSPYNRENHGNMKSDDGKVWVGGLALKIKPDGDGLKVVGHNFRNAYELAVDSRGDMWQNDNDDQVVTCRATWLMEGGNAGYFSTDGTRYWQADQRPDQDVFTAHWHQEDPGVIPAGDQTGAGAPTGVVMYEDDALGENYRGMLLSADAGRNVIFGYHPKQHQSGYDLGKRFNFITSLSEDNEGYVWNDSAMNRQTDKWFRPSDVAVGTEGAIYVADWYDPVVGGHQMADSTGYGRIYRITAKNKELVRPVIDMSSAKGQLNALLSPAVNVRFEAYQRLVKGGDAIIPDVEKMLESKNAFHQARAIWLLAGLGENGKRKVEELLKHKNANIRAVALRALRQHSDDITTYAQRLVDDPSAFVKREVIIGLSDYPYEQKKPILLQLVKDFDANDRWYIEALGAAVSGHEDDFLQGIVNVLNPGDTKPENWNDAFEMLVWRLHPAAYIEQLKARAASDKLSNAKRQRAMTALAFINDRRAVMAMLELSKNKNKAMADQATYWISFRQSNDWYKLADWSRINIDPARERKIAEMKVKQNYVLDARMPFDERRRNARAMARDLVGSNMILALVVTEKFPKKLYQEVRDLMLNHSDQTIRIQASPYFGDEASQTYDIPAIAKLKADVGKGKLIFSNKCGSCHRLGASGNDIGPELTAIGKKFDRQTLMDAIVNPSSGIVFGYEAWNVQTNDGQSYFGFLVADGKEIITIKDLSGVKHPIPVNKITSRKKAEKSLMPTAATLGLSEQELANIVAYLN